MPALQDDTFVIRQLQCGQGGIGAMDGLEFAQGHGFEFFGVAFLQCTDDIGMTAENV